MKKSLLTNKTILVFLIAVAGVSANAKSKFVSKEQLEAACVSQEAIENMLHNRLILNTKVEGFYRLNKKKIEKELANPENQEVIEFLKYLKLLVGPETQVTQKDPCMMTYGSQDIMMDK
jgi:predicted transcriptional regulator